MFDPLMSVLSSVVVAAVTAVSTVLVARTKARSDRQAARGPEWEAFSKNVREQFEALLAAERERYSLMIARLEGRVEKLEEDSLRYRRQRDVAVAHIRLWRAAHPESVGVLVVPEELQSFF